MTLAAILASMALFAAAQWGVAFFQRTHGLSNQAAGLAAGGIGLLATFGAVAGGMLADRMWARNARGVLLLPAVCCAAAFPLSLAAFQVLEAGAGDRAARRRDGARDRARATGRRRHAGARTAAHARA